MYCCFISVVVVLLMLSDCSLQFYTLSNGLRSIIISIPNNRSRMAIFNANFTHVLRYKTHFCDGIKNN